MGRGMLLQRLDPMARDSVAKELELGDSKLTLGKTDGEAMISADVEDRL